MISSRLLIFGILFVACGRSIFAAELPPSEILKKVEAAYESMATFKATGEVKLDMEVDGSKQNTKTSFSILLEKPNRYLISWRQDDFPIPRMNQTGSVWSDGTQPFLYMSGLNAYSKVAGDDMAIASATGISGGIAFTIPALFLSVFKEHPAPFSRLKDVKLVASEKIEGDDCYVLSGSSDVSKEESFWISKSNFLIRQYRHSLEAPEGGRGISEMDDAQLEESIKALGREVTKESKQEMKRLIEQSEELFAMTKIKGTSTEIYREVSSPMLKREDFEFDLPAGVILKESLFDGFMPAESKAD